MATIFHIALSSEWAAAQASGVYTTSTLGRSLADEGFIHASRGDQWTAVRDRFYADVAEPLVLLHIDTDRLDVPVIEEVVDPATGETFPHIYGRLPAAAVIKAIPLGTAASAATTAPVAAPARAAADGPGPATALEPTAHATPSESFSRVFFREMFFNVTLLCVVIGIGLLGALAGGAVNDEGGTGIGGLVGMAVGIAVSAVLFRRRHRTG